jgi:hypothetical protein
MLNVDLYLPLILTVCDSRKLIDTIVLCHHSADEQKVKKLKQSLQELGTVTVTSKDERENVEVRFSEDLVLFCLSVDYVQRSEQFVNGMCSLTSKTVYLINVVNRGCLFHLDPTSAISKSPCLSLSLICISYGNNEIEYCFLSKFVNLTFHRSTRDAYSSLETHNLISYVRVHVRQFFWIIIIS